MNQNKILAALLLVAIFTLASCGASKRTFKKDSPCGQIDKPNEGNYGFLVVENS